MSTSKACVSVCAVVGLLAAPASAVTAIGWRSVREHGGGAVPLAIELDAAAAGLAAVCEPRRDGVQRIEVDFDVDVSGLLAGTVEAEDLTHGGWIAATGQYTISGGTTLVAEFKFANPAWPGSPPEFFGLPDETCCRIGLAGTVLNLAGDSDCMVRVLAGDVNGLTPPYGDGKTDLTDMAQLKSVAVAGAPLIGDNVRFDVNTDGKIDLTDMALVKSLNGHSATCPAWVPDMAFIPAGEFQMGDSFTEGWADERPVHAVFTDAFFMDRCAVTNQTYADALNWAWNQGGLITVIEGVVYKDNSDTNYPYCETTVISPTSRITWDGSTFGVISGRENHPMAMVSWYGAVAYATWRSTMLGKPPCYDLSTWECNWGSGYRLPTEAEWEKAARGGVAGHRFPWSDTNTIQHTRANYISDDYYPYDTSETRGLHPAFSMGPSPHTNPVDYFAPNDYGLHDMAGNVWEWCHDWYLSTYYGSSPYDNPHGPATAQISRVLRGGGWSASVHYSRVAARTFRGHYPGYRYDNTGFRLALDAP